SSRGRAVCRRPAECGATGSRQQHPTPQGDSAAVLLCLVFGEVLGSGLGPQLAARVPAEIGADRTRFADARALKSYAGSAPITRASGKKRFVGRRFVKNNRLMHAGFLWAFSDLQASPGVNAHSRRRREHGDRHNAAQRHLLNRFLGQFHRCLQTRQHFDGQHAFASVLQAPA
ncbi:transposase, partial [Streptomyces sp. NPDC004069]